jgi:LysM domain
VVGYKRQQLFTSDAIKEIAYYSQGFPRLINTLCDNALLIAYATSQKRITRAIVREAAGDLRLDGQAGDPFIDEEDGKLARELGIRKSSGGTRSGRASYDGQLVDGSWWGLRIVLAILLLGIGGMGVYAWRVNASFLEEFGQQLATIPHTLHGTVKGWIGNLGPGEPLRESQQQPLSNSQSMPLTGKIGPAPATDIQTVESPIESRDSHLASEPRKVSDVSDTSSTGSRDNDRGRAVAPIAEMAGWREKPIAVQPGSTVAEIAANFYGAQRNLGLDFIKEYNTHIENLNRIIAGQRLWLPPLSRETLVRQQPDGSYRLILTSFRNPQQSMQLAQSVRLKGYDVVVTQRRVSNDLLLYRVEIGGLENVDVVNQVWEIALANQWIAFTDNS